MPPNLLRRSVAFLVFASSLAAQSAEGHSKGASGSRSPEWRLPPGLLGGVVENRGQWPAEAKFRLRAGGSAVFLTDQGLRIARTDFEGRSAAVFLSFEDGEVRAPEPRDAMPGMLNFFRGADAHVAGVKRFAEARYVEVYPGVNVVVCERNGLPAYDLELAPGADLDAVVVFVQGVERLRLGDDGSMIADTTVGPLRQTEPIAWEIDAAGAARPLSVRFRLIDENRFGFVAQGRDPSARAVVDPSLDWSGYVGGDGLDEIFAVDVDQAGFAYLGGRSASTNFPTSPGAFDVSLNVGNFDAVVAKINRANSTLVYGTYLGGSGTDRVEALRVNAAGEAFLTGQGGAAWPVTPGAFDTTYAGNGDMFVTKLSASGGALVFSTYIGGTAEERGHALEIDAAGNIYVAGETLSTSSYPSTPSAINTGLGAPGTWNACVTKVNANGASLGYSVRFGGAAVDRAYGIRVDDAGLAYVVGATNSANFFTTPGALATGAGFDTFVVKLNAIGSAYVYSARIGGLDADQAFACELGPDGSVYAVGTAGVGFPVTPGAYKVVGDGSDGFAYRLNAAGSQLLYSTFLGGGSSESAQAAALDGAGRLYIAGYTNSSNFPVTSNALDASFNGGGAPADGFVAKLNETGTGLLYGSYFGGEGNDCIHAIRLESNGRLWIAGSTTSVSLPVVGGGPFGAAALAHVGFAARLALPMSANSTVVGSGWDAAAPFPVFAAAPLRFGTIAGFSGQNAPPNAIGAVMASAELSIPLDLGSGAFSYGDPFGAFAVAGVAANSGGQWGGSLPFLDPIPALEGVSIMLQAAFLDPSLPFGLALTNGIRTSFGD